MVTDVKRLREQMRDSCMTEEGDDILVSTLETFVDRSDATASVVEDNETDDVNTGDEDVEMKEVRPCGCTGEGSLDQKFVNL